jgi:hypothetical protein
MSEKINKLVGWEAKSEIIRWPAIILADKRTDKVIGRIRFLTNSIKIKKGANNCGAPWGIRWAISLLVVCVKL